MSLICCEAPSLSRRQLLAAGEPCLAGLFCRGLPRVPASAIRAWWSSSYAARSMVSRPLDRLGIPPTRPSTARSPFRSPGNIRHCRSIVFSPSIRPCRSLRAFIGRGTPRWCMPRRGSDCPAASICRRAALLRTDSPPRRRWRAPRWPRVVRCRRCSRKPAVCWHCW